MKILCDSCHMKEAFVFCSVDEAALCDICNVLIHEVNNLSTKHHHLYLQSPSQNPPTCDICQERKAFIFCLEDRAVLCRECDIPIHDTNDHTRKHNRFLITGVGLSSSSISSTKGSTSKKESENMLLQKVDGKKEEDPTVDNVSVKENINEIYSNFSEYLVKMVPGCHVEDLLDYIDISKMEELSQFQEVMKNEDVNPGGTFETQVPKRHQIPTVRIENSRRRWT